MALVNAGIIPEDFIRRLNPPPSALYISTIHSKANMVIFTSPLNDASLDTNPEIVFRLAKRGVPFDTMQYFVRSWHSTDSFIYCVHPTLSPEEKKAGGQSIYIARYPQKACEHGIEALAKLPPSGCYSPYAMNGLPQSLRCRI